MPYLIVGPIGTVVRLNYDLPLEEHLMLQFGKESRLLFHSHLHAGVELQLCRRQSLDLRERLVT